MPRRIPGRGFGRGWGGRGGAPPRRKAAGSSSTTADAAAHVPFRASVSFLLSPFPFHTSCGLCLALAPAEIGGSYFVLRVSRAAVLLCCFLVLLCEMVADLFWQRVLLRWVRERGAKEGEEQELWRRRPARETIGLGHAGDMWLIGPRSGSPIVVSYYSPFFFSSCIFSFCLLIRPPSKL